VLVIVLRSLGSGSWGSLFALLLGPISGGLWFARAIESEVFALFILGSSHGTSEDVLVLLFGEVNVIVSVRMAELSGVVSVILPDGVWAELSTLSILPGLELKIADGAALVVVRHWHGALVGLVVDNLSAEIPLLLLLKSLENVIRADLHHVNLVIEAVISTPLAGTDLELADLLIAAAGDEVGDKGHVLREFHWVLAETTILVTEGLALTVGVPVIMSLIVAMILVEWIIEVTIDPWSLGNMTKEERHLGVIIRFVVITSTDGVKSLVEIRVNDLVSKVVVTLLPVVLWEVRRVEVDRCHI
jgi:hypothetical protein